jgi:hypothetical protein
VRQSALSRFGIRVAFMPTGLLRLFVPIHPVHTSRICCLFVLELSSFFRNATWAG